MNIKNIIIKVGTGILTLFFICAIIINIYGIINRTVDSNIFILFSFFDIIISGFIAKEFFSAFKEYKIPNA